MKIKTKNKKKIRKERRRKMKTLKDVIEVVRDLREELIENGFVWEDDPDEL